MSDIRRPVMRYHGGKWRLAPWIISHFPAHRVYVEPFGGAASVLMQKPRAYAEIYNDLDSEVVNVFRMMRSPRTARQLERALRFTPYSRDDFDLAFVPARDHIEQARRTIVKSFMGHGSDSIHRGSSAESGMMTRISMWGKPGFKTCTTKRPTTGLRSDVRLSGSTPASEWSRYPDAIGAFCDRLQGVVIENRPAIDVIKQYDKHDALIFVDPPYVRLTRRERYHGFTHEMDDEEHVELIDALLGVSGMVVLSGYWSDLYGQRLSGWRLVDTTSRTMSSTGKKGHEYLWFSPNVPARQLELMG